MKTPSRLAAAVLSAAVAVPPSAWSCPHRVDPASVQAQTGTLSGNVRIERVSAKPAAQALKAGIVKIFVVAPGAKVSRYDLSDAEAKTHDALRSEAAAAYRPKSRGMTRGGEGFSYVTKDGTANVVVTPRTESSWSEIAKALALGSSPDDQRYEAWVAAVRAAGHQLWSAEAVPTGESAAEGRTSDAFKVAVQITYSGDPIKNAAKDKWLEALGNFNTPVILKTDAPNDKLAQAFASVLGEKRVKAEIGIPDSWGAQDSAAKPNGEVEVRVASVGFRIYDGKILFANRKPFDGPALSADNVPQADGVWNPNAIAAARERQSVVEAQRLKDAEAARRASDRAQRVIDGAQGSQVLAPVRERQ